MVKNIAIISLSRGLLGESFVQHEVDLGIKRLEALGLNIRFTENACKGLTYLADHPEKRAEDLLNALQDDRVDMILCAIGGDDTYRLLPYLFDHAELKHAVKKKIFLGFSDTTINHFMLHKVGLPTFYGQAFLPDLCELSNDMLPYTRHYFEELIRTGSISRIQPSNVWYDGRTNWEADQIGVDMPDHKNTGFQLLQGNPVFQGKILGGCIESIYDMFNADRYADTVQLCEKYALFPTLDDWTGRILLLETSEERSSPALYRDMLTALKNTGIFNVISGILMGKPQNEVYFEEYKRILMDVVDDPALPIVANINIGHATPRCIIPFGVPAVVDTKKQQIVFHNTNPDQ